MPVHKFYWAKSLVWEHIIDLNFILIPENFSENQMTLNLWFLTVTNRFIFLVKVRSKTFQHISILVIISQLISKIYIGAKLVSTFPCNHSEIVVKWIILSYKIKIFAHTYFYYLVLCENLIILPFPQVVRDSMLISMTQDRWVL